MKIRKVNYPLLSKVTATLLLMAFLLPAGLHAKQVVDFCMMEMNHHEMATTASSHDHCDTEPAEESESDHQECDWGFICACSAGQSQLADKEWIPVTNNLEITLTQQGELLPFFASSEHVQADKQIRIGEYDPPLWLLYDTFLM